MLRKEVAEGLGFFQPDHPVENFLPGGAVAGPAFGQSQKCVVMFNGRLFVASSFKSKSQIQLDLRKLRGQQFSLAQGFNGFTKLAPLLTNQGTLHP